MTEAEAILAWAVKPTDAFTGGPISYGNHDHMAGGAVDPQLPAGAWLNVPTSLLGLGGLEKEPYATRAL